MTTSIALETLGCKVNQYESSYFLEVLKEAGYRLVSFRDPADIYVVHGCAVTARATFQTRQLLRRAQRLNPEAIIVSAGCQAQIEPERIAEERLATHILGNNDKFDLISLVAGLPEVCPVPCEPPAIRTTQTPSGPCPSTPYIQDAPAPSSRSRTAVMRFVPTVLSPTSAATAEVSLRLRFAYSWIASWQVDTRK